MKQVKCEDCIWNQTFVDGDGWNEPREEYSECNCKLAITDEDICYTEIKSNDGFDGEPITCKFYDAGKCHECKEQITETPVIYASGVYENYKVCSEKCRKTLQDKLDLEIKEMMGDDR